MGQTPQKFSAQVRDVLAVAGFPTSDNGRISLADGGVRVVGHGSSLTPRRSTAEEASQVQAVDSLVAVEGEVTHDAQIPANRLITLRSGSRLFVARVLRSARDPAMTFPSGTVLRVTGILESTRRDAGGKDRTFTDFELLARTDADLAVIRAAPWLTAADALDGRRTSEMTVKVHLSHLFEKLEVNVLDVLGSCDVSLISEQWAGVDSNH